MDQPFQRFENKIALVIISPDVVGNFKFLYQNLSSNLISNAYLITSQDIIANVDCIYKNNSRIRFKKQTDDLLHLQQAVPGN